MAVLALLSGCSTTVDGSARRHTSAGAALQQLLPSADEVATAVGNPIDPAGPPHVGSIDMLPNGIRDSEGASPLDCLGAVTPLMRVVYESAGVRAVAWADFARLGHAATVSSAEAGVVQLGTDGEASRLFSRFAAQWQSCEDTTVTMHAGAAGGLDLTVTRVRVEGPILSAIILSDGGDGSVFPTEHAVGVTADCIVDVDVAITDPDPARRVTSGRAAEIVRLMLAKIGSAR